MPFELLHFRGSDDLLKDKGMDKDVTHTLEYLDSVLYGSLQRRELLRQALDEMGWRQNRDLSVMPGRRYYFKGLKQHVAIEGSLSFYEYILEGLMRLQIGHQKGAIEVGILLLPDNRGEKTPYGSTRQLLIEEMDYLFPTIDLPVAIALLDLGKPGDSMEDVQQSQPKAIKQPVDHAKKEKASPGSTTKEKPDPDPADSKGSGDQKTNSSKEKSNPPETNPSQSIPLTKMRRSRKKSPSKSTSPA